MRRLEQEMLDEGVFSSSLINEVLTIEAARRSRKSIGNGFNSPPLYQRSLDQGLDPDGHLGMAIIIHNPEFVLLRNEILAKENGQGSTSTNTEMIRTQSLERYAQFLSSGAPLEAKLFAASEPFRLYIREASLGPSFQRVLAGIKSADPRALSFTEQNFTTLSALDKTYFYLDRFNELFRGRRSDQMWLLDEIESSRRGLTLHAVFDTRSKDHSYYRENGLPEAVFSKRARETMHTAFSRYTMVADTLLNAVFNRKDSPWRKFVMENFEVVFTAACALEKDIRYYNPLAAYTRIQKLFGGYKAGDWDFFAKYVWFSRELYPNAREFYDEDILKMDDRRPRTFVGYAQEMHEALQQLDEKDIPIQSYIGHWPQKHAQGAISEEELLEVAHHAKAIAQVFFSLPEHVRTRFGDYPLYNILCEAGTSDFYKHGEQIASLIGVGIVPFDRMLSALDGQDDKLATIKEFGKAIFDVHFTAAKRDTNGMIYIASGLVMQFLEEKIDVEDLLVIAAHLPAIDQAIQLFLQHQKDINFPKTPLADELEMLYKSQWENPADVAAAAALLSQGILPTRRLIAYLKDNEGGISKLRELQQETTAGKFDSENEVQKDLEYSVYLSIPRKDREVRNYQLFSELPYASIKDLFLLPSEQMEAEAASFEAAKLYWFIAQRAQANRRLAVIGNESYGAYFITDPLKPHLEELGVQVSRYYIHSGGDMDQNRKRLLKAIQIYLDRENPDDIIIVDGSRNSFSGGSPRLPAALAKYYEWFRSRYHVAHWVPIPGKKVLIGQTLVDYTPPDFSTPQVILANPVIDPKRFPEFPKHLSEHQPAAFDDVLGDVKEEIVFTPKGVQKAENGRTRQQLIDLVQTHMGRILPDMINKTNPLFA